MKLSERLQQADTDRRSRLRFPLAEWGSPRGARPARNAGDNKRGYVVGFKGFTGFAGFTGFNGCKKAAAVAGAALALAVMGGQGQAQAQVQTQAQVQAQVPAGKPALTAPAIIGSSVVDSVVDPIVERVCATPLPVRLPLCGEQGGGGTGKPVNGWQIEQPKPKQ